MVIISVETDEQWLALVDVLGSPDWATQNNFRVLESRLTNRETIEKHLQLWTREHGRNEVFQLLQGAGIPCGPMLTGMEMLNDQHLQERGWTLEIDQPGVGYMKLEGPAWLSETMGGPITFPSPDLAGHTREIAADILGISEKRVRDLIERGALEV